MTSLSTKATYDPDSIVRERDYAHRPYVSVSRQDWVTAIVFLLAMSMIGLQFPLGYLIVPFMLLRSWKRSRTHFIIQLTLFCGGYALIGEHNMPFKLEDLGMLLGFLGVFIYRKPPLVRKIVIAWVFYAVSLLALAMFSDETMAIQIRTLRTWLAFIYFLVPLMCFAGEKFDMGEFLQTLVPYVLVLCTFYIMDAFIINGHVLVPNSYMDREAFAGYKSAFWNPAIYSFGYFPRKYPPGIYWLALIVLPLSRYYRFRWWQWALVLGGLMATRTFTVIIAIIFGYMVFQPNPGKKMRYAILGVTLLAVGYTVDSTLPVNPDNEDSTLRIKSSLDQIFALQDAQDDEDFSETGSGRIAQVLPKFELMYSYGKEWTGIGFLHPQLTKSTKYIIINEYYTDIERNQEVATGIEVIPLQVLLTVGYIGLIIHFAFYIYLYVAIRRLKYSLYFLSVGVVTFIFGLGGFSGWITPMCLFLLALTMAAVLLANRDTVWSHLKNKKHSGHEQTLSD